MWNLICSVQSQSICCKYNISTTITLDKDDKQGFLNVSIGEMLGERYKVSSISGKGVFGSVIKAIDLDTLKEVAIKVIRKGDTYEQSGEREISILTMLNSCDPNGMYLE